MSVENVVKFYNVVMKDDVLKQKLQDVNEKTLTEEVFKNKVLPVAKTRGYDFTYDEAKAYYKHQGEKTELSVDELENVSGGGCRALSAPEGQPIARDDMYAANCTFFECKSSGADDTTSPVCGDCTHFYRKNNIGYCDVPTKR